MNEIKYPLIVISEKEGLVFVVDKYEELRTTSKRLVNEGYFENLAVYSSDYCEYQIINIKFDSYPGLFRGFNLFTERLVLVDYDFKRVSKQIKFDELKMKVNNIFNTNRSFWESAGDIDQLGRELKAEDTFEELILSIRPFVQ